MPSTRIAILNMLPFLQAEGMRFSVLHEPAQPNEQPDLSGVAERAIAAGCDVVVLQKVHGASALALIRQLTGAGVRTVYMVCDVVTVPMVEAADATVAVTEYLKSLYPERLHARIHVVHDGIERPDIYKDKWGAENADGPLRAALVTSSSLDRLPAIGCAPPWLNVRIVGRYNTGLAKWRHAYWQWSTQPRGNRLNYLRFLADRRIQRIAWSPDGVYRELQHADIGIIPVDPTEPIPVPDAPYSWKNKSENRLTLKMSVGLPVIATPIPSYEPVIEHGVNGYFARSPHDWATCLRALRDPAHRREMGLAARASVAQKYSMQAQAAKLIRVLRGDSDDPQARQRPAHESRPGPVESSAATAGAV